MGAFQVASCPGFMAVTPYFQLSEVQLLQPYRACWNYEYHIWQFLWKQSIQNSRILSCVVTCAAEVLWFFETILLNVYWFLSVNADFRPLFLFAYVVFPWFVHAGITLETVALDNTNGVAVFVTDAPAKHAPTKPKSDKSPIFRFFNTGYRSIQSVMYWHEHYRM
jgi:hypothetical protein